MDAHPPAAGDRWGGDGMTTATGLSEQERTAICTAVEADPRGFIRALELRSVELVEALKDGDDEAEIETLVSLVYRLKRGEGA